MKKSPWLVAEIHRCSYPEGHLFQNSYGDRYGIFMIPFKTVELKVIVSAADIDPDFPWDHVSVSLQNRCPNWPEMCHIKDVFFDDDEAVVQYHPPRSEYVNCHPYCLHLWKPLNEKLPLPPRIMVGPDKYLKGSEHGK